MTKRKGRRRHTEFENRTSDEISEIARNPNIAKAQRRKAQTEEKTRGVRNRRKRKLR
jgi:hypothetical protein